MAVIKTSFKVECFMCVKKFVSVLCIGSVLFCSSVEIVAMKPLELIHGHAIRHMPLREALSSAIASHKLSETSPFLGKFAKQ
jgi:hypothetical protein